MLTVSSFYLVTVINNVAEFPVVYLFERSLSFFASFLRLIILMKRSE